MYMNSVQFDEMTAGSDLPPFLITNLICKGDKAMTELFLPLFDHEGQSLKIYNNTRRQKFNKIFFENDVGHMIVERRQNGKVNLVEEVKFDRDCYSIIAKSYWVIVPKSSTVTSSVGELLHRKIIGGRFCKFLDGDRFNFCTSNLQSVKKRVGDMKHKNSYRINDDDDAVFSVKGGHEFIVDKSDIDLVSQYPWRISIKNGGYIVAREPEAGRTIRLNRLLVNAKEGEVVDHINHQVLDNRKCNLRCCSVSQNLHNPKSKVQSNNTSGFRGVDKTSKGSWRARITVNRLVLDKRFLTRDDAISQRIAWEQELNPSGLLT
jgi:hypothetical protein